MGHLLRRIQGRLEKKRTTVRSEAGQATIEFALVMIFFLSFFVFYVQLTLVFAWGSWIQYATFMSARAYLSAGPTEEEQRERASSVLAAMVKESATVRNRDRMPMVAKGVGEGDLTGGFIGKGSSRPQDAWMEGVSYSFESKVFLIPMGRLNRSARDSEANRLRLKSESWLGRHPDKSSCESFISSFLGVADNGC